MCQRRWAFQYGHLAIREAAGDAAEAGTRVHKWLENTAPEDRAEPVWKKYEIQRMADLLQAETPADVVREAVIDMEIDGVLFTLRIDGQYVTPAGAGVMDYKTVGKPAGVKSVSKLTDDPQRLLYTRATGAVESYWIYGVWSTFKVKPVKVPSEAADKERFKLHVLSKAEAMALVPFDADPLSLPANEDSCKLFPPAGCPHYSKCHDLSDRLLYKNACGEVLPVVDHEEKEPEVSDLFNVAPTRTEVKSEFSSVRVEVSPAQALIPVPKDPPAVVRDGKFIDTLYINAIPMIGFEDVLHATTFLHEAERMVSDSQHVHHVGLIDYSKGYVATEVQLIENLRLREAEHGAIPFLVLETTSRLGKECMLALVNASRRVVRGVI